MADPQQPYAGIPPVAAVPEDVTTTAKAIRLALTRLRGSDPLAGVPDADLVARALKSPKWGEKLAVYLSPESRQVLSGKIERLPTEGVVSTVLGATSAPPVAPTLPEPATRYAAPQGPAGLDALSTQVQAGETPTAKQLALFSMAPRAGVSFLSNLAGAGAGLVASPFVTPAGGAAVQRAFAAGGPMLAEMPIQRMEQALGLRGDLNPEMIGWEGLWNLLPGGGVGKTGLKRVGSAAGRQSLIGGAAAGTTYLRDPSTRGEFSWPGLATTTALGLGVGGAVGAGLQGATEGVSRAFRKGPYASRGAGPANTVWTPEEFEAQARAVADTLNRENFPGMPGNPGRAHDPASDFTFHRNAAGRWEPDPLAAQSPATRARVTTPAAPAEGAAPATPGTAAATPESPLPGYQTVPRPDDPVIGAYWDAYTQAAKTPATAARTLNELRAAMKGASPDAPETQAAVARASALQDVIDDLNLGGDGKGERLWADLQKILADPTLDEGARQRWTDRAARLSTVFGPEGPRPTPKEGVIAGPGEGPPDPVTTTDVVPYTPPAVGNDSGWRPVPPPTEGGPSAFTFQGKKVVSVREGPPIEGTAQTPAWREIKLEDGTRVRVDLADYKSNVYWETSPDGVTTKHTKPKGQGDPTDHTWRSRPGGRSQYRRGGGRTPIGLVGPVAAEYVPEDEDSQWDDWLRTGLRMAGAVEAARYAPSSVNRLFRDALIKAGVKAVPGEVDLRAIMRTLQRVKSGELTRPSMNREQILIEKALSNRGLLAGDHEATPFSESVVSTAATAATFKDYVRPQNRRDFLRNLVQLPHRGAQIERLKGAQTYGKLVSQLEELEAQRRWAEDGGTPEQIAAVTKKIDDVLAQQEQLRITEKRAFTPNEWETEERLGNDIEEEIRATGVQPVYQPSYETDLFYNPEAGYQRFGSGADAGGDLAYPDVEGEYRTVDDEITRRGEDLIDQFVREYAAPAGDSLATRLVKELRLDEDTKQLRDIGQLVTGAVPPKTELQLLVERALGERGRGPREGRLPDEAVKAAAMGATFAPLTQPHSRRDFFRNASQLRGKSAQAAEIAQAQELGRLHARYNHIRDLIHRMKDEDAHLYPYGSAKEQRRLNALLRAEEKIGAQIDAIAKNFPADHNRIAQEVETLRGLEKRAEVDALGRPLVFPERKNFASMEEYTQALDQWGNDLRASDLRLTNEGDAAIERFVQEYVAPAIEAKGEATTLKDVLDYAVKRVTGAVKGEAPAAPEPTQPLAAAPAAAPAAPPPAEPAPARLGDPTLPFIAPQRPLEARLADGRVGMGGLISTDPNAALKTGMIATLRSSIYKSAPAGVLAKEMMQNARDGSFETQRATGIPGRVEVHVWKNDSSKIKPLPKTATAVLQQNGLPDPRLRVGYVIETRDNGPGVSPTILEKAYSDLNETTKAADPELVGKLGIAKLVTTFNPDILWHRVESIFVNPQYPNQKWKLVWEGRPIDLVQGVKEKITPAPDGAETGTVVTNWMDLREIEANLNNGYRSGAMLPSGIEMLQKILNASPNLPPDTRFVVHAQDFEPSRTLGGPGRYVDRPSPMQAAYNLQGRAPRIAFDTPVAKIKVYLSPPPSKASANAPTSYPYQISNNGVWQAQGQNTINLPDSLGPVGAEGLIIDVSPTVPPKHPDGSINHNYPFDAGREGIKTEIWSSIVQKLHDEVDLIKQTKTSQLTGQYHNAPVMRKYSGVEIGILDASGQIDEGDLHNFLALPAVQRLGYEVATLIPHIQSLLRHKFALQPAPMNPKSGGELTDLLTGPKRFLLMISDEAYGVHIPDPAAPTWTGAAGREATLAFDPFSMVETPFAGSDDWVPGGGVEPHMFAGSMSGIILHEMAHNRPVPYTESAHGDTFSRVLNQLVAAYESYPDLVNKIYKRFLYAVADPDSLKAGQPRFSNEFDEARAEYLRLRGIAGSARTTLFQSGTPADRSTYPGAGAPGARAGGVGGGGGSGPAAPASAAGEPAAAPPGVATPGGGGPVPPVGDAGGGRWGPERGAATVGALAHAVTPAVTGGLGAAYGAASGTDSASRQRLALEYGGLGLALGAGMSAAHAAAARSRGGIPRPRAQHLWEITPPAVQARMAANPRGTLSKIQQLLQTGGKIREELANFFEPFHALEKIARVSHLSHYAGKIRSAINLFKESQNELRNLREGIKQDFHQIFAQLWSEGDMQEFWRHIALRRDISIAERQGNPTTEVAGMGAAALRAERTRAWNALLPDEQARIDSAIRTHDAVMRRIGQQLVDAGDMAATTLDVNSDYFPHMVRDYFVDLQMGHGSDWKARFSRGRLRAALGGERETLHDYVGVITKYLGDMRSDLIRARTEHQVAQIFDISNTLPPAAYRTRYQLPRGYTPYHVQGVNPANHSTYVIPQWIAKELTRRSKPLMAWQSATMGLHNLWKGVVLNSIWGAFNTTNFLGDTWRAFTYFPVSEGVAHNPARTLLAGRDAYQALRLQSQYGNTAAQAYPASLTTHQRQLLDLVQLAKQTDLGTGAATAEVGAQITRDPRLRHVARDPLYTLAQLSRWENVKRGVYGVGIRPLFDTGNALLWYGGLAREHLENFPRFARFLVEADLLAKRQGMRGNRLERALQSGALPTQTPEARAKVAAEVTRHVMIDYSALTPEEKIWMRGILAPFYAFYKHNTRAYLPGVAKYPTVNPITLDVNMSKSAGVSAIMSAASAGALAFGAAVTWNEYAMPELVARYSGDPRDAQRFRRMAANLPRWMRYQPHLLLPWWDDPKSGEMRFAYLGLQTPMVAAAQMVGAGGGLQRLRESVFRERDAGLRRTERQGEESWSQIQRNVGGAITPLIQAPATWFMGKDVRTGQNLTDPSMTPRQKAEAYGRSALQSTPFLGNLGRAREQGGEGPNRTAWNLFLAAMLGGSRTTLRETDLQASALMEDIQRTKRETKISHDRRVNAQARAMAEIYKDRDPRQVEAMARTVLAGKGPMAEYAGTLVREMLIQLSRQNRQQFVPVRNRILNEYNLERLAPQEPTPAGTERLQHWGELRDARQP